MVEDAKTNLSGHGDKDLAVSSNQGPSFKGAGQGELKDAGIGVGEEVAYC